MKPLTMAQEPAVSGTLPASPPAGVSFADLVAHANDIIIVTDAPTRRIVYVNPAFTGLTGYSAAEAMGRSPGRLLQGPRTDAATVKLLSDALRRQVPVRTEILNYSKSGREYWLDINIVPLRAADGTVTHFAAIERDISDTKRMQQQLAELALLDALTGLANRRAFADALVREVARARRDASPLALVMFDIDHFKSINDRHGHAAGDAVLRSVGERLRPALRPHDILARVGGEEFAVLLPGANLCTGTAVAERSRALLQTAAVAFATQSIAVTASFGAAALEANDDAAGEQLMRRADAGTYAAKRRGRNRVCIEPAAAPAPAPAPCGEDGGTGRAQLMFAAS
jgi:diguanylate cyclase (GGDEF)-like protein/PAS domain S-box-containing protein